MKGKEKLVGLIVGIVVGVLGAAAGLQVDEFKAGFCGAPSPAPSPVVMGVTGVTGTSSGR